MLLVDRNKYSENRYNMLTDKKNLSFIEKILLCLLVLTSKSFKPVLRFDDGTEIDFRSNKIILRNTLNIHCKEDIKISSEKNIIIDSGKKYDPERSGYRYSIWLNCPKDEKGNPLKTGDKQI